MSTHLLMESARLTSPDWADGVGLLAENISAEVDDDFNPISADVGRLIGPSPMVVATIARLSTGGVPVVLASTSAQGRELSGVVRSCVASGHGTAWRLEFDRPA